MTDAAASTRQKALSLNLDGTTYGTFAARFPSSDCAVGNRKGREGER